MYSAEIIWSALVAKAASGGGWRRIAEGLAVPGTTVRGWLRRFAGRAELVRGFFTRAGLEVGIDLPGVAATGSVCGDAVAASGLLVAAVRQRFVGSGPDEGPPPGWQVVCAVSGGRLLWPGWPPVVRASSSRCDTPGVAGNTGCP